ncbi:MAG TPA: hypothetical protein VMT00_06390 [Thermoanaerobaculia bacterium]|nr:hypothetical protein [Thermoanaerobaculia bacterium]
MNPEAPNAVLVFDRTPLARLVSCAAAFGAAALFFDYLSRGSDDLHFVPLIALGLLLVGTILSALLQYGDHIYVGSTGLLYENRWLPFLRRGRWMRWDDVVEVREIRRKILILLSRDGRRVLVDAIIGYAIARREILRRTPHAVISGTLTQEDRP